MKILLFTDNHFCSYSSILKNKGQKYSVRLENQIKSLNWVEEVAQEEKCDKVVCLGDFFDRENLNSLELTALQEIKWSNIPHVFLVGNHEMGVMDLSINSVSALAKIGKVIDKPQLVNVDSTNIVYLPYIIENERKPFKEYLNNLLIDSNLTQEQQNNKIIVLSHNDICGIKYGFYESKIGFNINEISSYCNLFINGHLHNQQQVNEKILNLGNLTGLNFSEDALKYSHCIAILDTDTLKIDLINNPYALNFTKLEILNENDIKKIPLLDNLILSIKTYQPLVSKIKDTLNNYSNVLTYRINTVPQNIIKNSQKEIKTLLNNDYLDSFIKFIKENIDNSAILEEELSFIK